MKNVTMIFVSFYIVLTAYRCANNGRTEGRQEEVLERNPLSVPTGDTISEREENTAVLSTAHQPAPLTGGKPSGKEGTVSLIDTTIEDVGKIRIMVDQGRIWIKSWNMGDSAVGSAPNVYLEDSIPAPVLPVYEIGLIENGLLQWTNITYTVNGFLFFAILDQESRTNVFAAFRQGREWEFIPTGAAVGCSTYHYNVGCKVLDGPRSRLLLKWPGPDYDEKNDKFFQFIKVLQYTKEKSKELGVLKFREWEGEYCDSAKIVEWYRAYQKIADRKKFDSYLNVLGKKD